MRTGTRRKVLLRLENTWPQCIRRRALHSRAGETAADSRNKTARIDRQVAAVDPKPVGRSVGSRAWIARKETPRRTDMNRVRTETARRRREVNDTVYGD